MMNKDYTYNPCSVCGKEVSDIKFYGGGLYCKEHLPKDKQEWLRQEFEYVEFRDYSIKSIDYKLDDGYLKINLSQPHFSSMFNNYYSIEIHLDILSFNFNSFDNEEFFIDFDEIKKLIAIAEQYKEME